MFLLTGFPAATRLQEVPVLTVYSPKHKRSGRYVGAWEAESLAAYLRQAIGGRAPMFPVDGELRCVFDICNAELSLFEILTSRLPSCVRFGCTHVIITLVVVVVFALCEWGYREAPTW